MIASAPEFRDTVLNSFLTAMHGGTISARNWDKDRFGHDGVDRSHTYEVDYHRQYMLYFLQNHAGFFEGWKCMSDEASRRWYTDLVLYRMLGHLHYRLPSNTDQHWALRKQARKAAKGPSPLGIGGMFGPLQHFEVGWNGETLNIDCWWHNVAWTFMLRQYFFERGGVRVQPEPGDYVVDAGACMGDTALAFASCVGEGGRVYSFDFIPNHVQVIRHNFEQNPQLAPRSTLFHYAVSSQHSPERSINISNEGVVLPSANIQNEQLMQVVPLASIDRMVESGEIEKIDFIKMDIEGSELDALRGAEASIRRFKPKLAISIYHRVEDPITIPLWIRDLGLGYRQYIDHYTIHHEETVLYAEAER